LHELARRVAGEAFTDGMTMNDMALAAKDLKGEANEPSIAAMLSRMKRERPTAKACPRCGKRVAARALDREVNDESPGRCRPQARRTGAPRRPR